MDFMSTRGEYKNIGFQQVVLEGLARDGGLFVPTTYPDLSDQLEKLRQLSYCDLAFEIFQPYTNHSIPESDLKNIIENSYATFQDQQVTPLKHLSNESVLELFHGPTLAFKDVALQFLGNLFEWILSQQNNQLNILGATSGDTGSAAIMGIRGKKNINIFILHPKGKISEIQEKQMTTVLDDNVFNIAIEGTFDDGQTIIKEVFNDLDFKDQYNLGAINSINFARVMAQIVYYFYSAFRFSEKYPDAPLIFSVPTGNFGDIYAGYLAKQMGLPIDKLILATNENDILYRVLTTGKYEVKDVFPSISPSMDIQIASNFERFLFDLLNRDSQKLVNKMEFLSKNGSFAIDDKELKAARNLFIPARVETARVEACIRKYAKNGYILDPHTAIGVAAAEDNYQDRVICLATAHPGKFKDSVESILNTEIELPEALSSLFNKESRCITTPANKDAITEIIRSKCNI
jgi:threonine synthase